MGPIAPIAAASVGVAIPAMIEPRTRKINNIGGTNDRKMGMNCQISIYIRVCRKITIKVDRID